MASSSNPWNQQVVPARQDNLNLYGSGHVYELHDTTILELDVFRSYFSVFSEPAVDIVVIYQVDQTNTPYGFGFVANEESFATGGTFRTEANTATTLRNSLFRLVTELSKIHTTSHPQGDMGKSVTRKYVNYVQFRIPSLLRDHQFSNYFNTFPACSFSVVALFKERPSGFGFLEKLPEDSYMNHFKWMVEGLKMTIFGGLATIPRSFLGQGVGSSMTYGVQQQSSDRGRGSAETEVPEISGSFLGQGVIGGRMAHSVHQQQRMGERGRGSAAPEVAQIPGRFLGQGVMGSRMAHSVQQQQQRGERGRGSAASEVIFNTSLNTFGFQPTVRMPHYAASTPSSAQASPSYVVGSAAVTAQSLSGSNSGGYPNPTQWPGSSNVAGQSYAVMQQQQQSSLHFQPTAGVFPYEAVNRPSSAHMWSGPSTGLTGQVLSARSAGQLETNQSSGSIFRGGYSNTLMQQQPGPSIGSQTTNTTFGSFFGATDQLFSGSFAGGQPTTGQWSRAVGANRPVQNSSGGSSSVNHPEYDMWSGPSAGVTRQVSSARSAGQLETDQWSGSIFGGGYSNTLMQQQQQQQPGPSIRSQTTNTTSVSFFGATDQLFSGSFAGGQPTTGQWSRAVGANRPVQNSSGGSSSVNHPEYDMWSGPSAGVTRQVSSARSAGQLETDQWSGSIFGGGYSNTLMQQQQQQPGPSIRSQTTNTTSGSFFGATDQLFSGSFAGGQPTTGQWSRAVGANRPVQNSSGGSSSVNYPDYDMWKM